MWAIMKRKVRILTDNLNDIEIACSNSEGDEATYGVCSYCIPMVFEAISNLGNES